MIGDEARRSGFNVMLAGAINLAREPRNGRNFEYGGEDPLLAANIVAAQIRGRECSRCLTMQRKVGPRGGGLRFCLGSRFPTYACPRESAFQPSAKRRWVLRRSIMSCFQENQVVSKNGLPGFTRVAIRQLTGPHSGCDAKKCIAHILYFIGSLSMVAVT